MVEFVLGLLVGWASMLTYFCWEIRQAIKEWEPVE